MKRDADADIYAARDLLCVLSLACANAWIAVGVVSGKIRRGRKEHRRGQSPVDSLRGAR